MLPDDGPSPQDLHQRDHRFRQLFEKAANPLLLLRGSAIVDCNEAALDILGASSKAQLFHSHPAALSPVRQPDGRESLPAAQSNIERALREGLLRFEWTHQRLDNEKPFTVLVTLSTLEFEGQAYLLSNWHDLTERHAAEAELRKLALVASRTTNAVIITSPQGHIEWVNDAFTRITDYTPEEVLGKKPGDFLQGPATDPETRQHMHDALAHQQGFRVEILNYSKHGRLYWLDIEVQPVRNPQGQLLHFMAIESEITQRKMAENALRESETLLRSFVRALPDTAFIIDEHGRYMDILSSGDDLLMAPREQLLGRTLEAIFPPDIAACLRAHIQRTLDTHSQQVLEYQITTQNGDRRWLEGRCAPMIHPGKDARHVVFISRDITERRNIEEDLLAAKNAADAANRAKSAFLATMSHEIRTPMNAIIGMTSLLLNTALSEEQRDFLETISSSGDALLSLINDILDYSKIEAGKIEIEHAPFDLTETLTGPMGMLASKAAEKNLELAWCIAPGTPRNFEGDGPRLRQILLNLLSNAVKFTDSGQITVEASASLLEDGRHRLHLQVTDTGIGIAPDVQHRLFQPFVQADNSTTRQYGGTGLGLAISRRLTELMQGTLSLDSTPGQGSSFHIALPLRALPPSPPSHNAEASLLVGKHLLLLHDNPLARQMIANEVLP